MGVGVGRGRALADREWRRTWAARGGPGAEGALQTSCPGVAVGGRRGESRAVGSGGQGRWVLAPAGSLAAVLTSFLPAAARPDQGRPEARGAPCARVHRGRARAASRNLAAGPTGLSPPGFLIVPELSSCVGS